MPAELLRRGILNAGQHVVPSKFEWIVKAQGVVEHEPKADQQKSDQQKSDQQKPAPNAVLDPLVVRS